MLDGSSATGRGSIRWHLEGFHSDGSLRTELELTRNQIAAVQHLFVREGDEWMMYGEYPLPVELHAEFTALLGQVELSPDLVYFVGATEDRHAGGLDDETCR